MNSKRLNLLLIVLLIVLGLGLLGGTYIANSVLQNRSQKLANLKALQATADAETQQLAQDKQDLTKYNELNQIAQSIVPQDKDQAEAVREIVNLAAESGINQLSSITFTESTLGGVGGTSTIKTSSGLTQVTPVKGIPGVYDLQITISQTSTQEVRYSTFVSFLTKLEQNRRTAQVSSITVQPDAKNPNLVAFTLIVDEFLKP